MQCSSTTFRINNAGIAAFTQAKVGSNCSEDYIGIEGKYLIINDIKLYFSTFYGKKVD